MRGLGSPTDAASARADEPWRWLGGHLWLSENETLAPIALSLAAVPPTPWPARETGHMVGAAVTPQGLFVLGDKRLARWRNGQWTFFSAPGRQGASLEKLPHEGPAFCTPTGLVLRPPHVDETVVPLLALAAGAKNPSSQVAGVPFFIDDGEDAEPFYLGAKLEEYLPDFAPDDRMAFTGLVTRLVTGATLTAASGFLQTVFLEGRLVPGAGAVVTVEGRLVIDASPSAEEKARLEVERVTTLFPDVAASARATVRFHHQHVHALRKAFSAPCWPKRGTPSDVAYDPARGKLAVALSCTANLFENKVVYLYGPKLEAIRARWLFVGE